MSRLAQVAVQRYEQAGNRQLLSQSSGHLAIDVSKQASTFLRSTMSPHFKRRAWALERVKGIEPSYSAWKAAALPLSYTRAGVELTRRAGGLNPPRRSRPNILGAADRPVPGP